MTANRKALLFQKGYRLERTGATAFWMQKYLNVNNLYFKGKSRNISLNFQKILNS